jgi:ceramide glucosyltransferase
MSVHFSPIHWAHFLSLWHFMLSTWLLAVSLVVFGTIRSLFKIRSPRATVDFGDVAELLPVSILKPLRGVDEGLEENLESFFQIDYPDFELLFSVADHDDPVVPLIQKLLDKFPHVQARLYVGSFDIGCNPKINNFFRAYKLAAHDWILVSDSNTRVASDYLKRIAVQFKNDVAMQTSVVYGSHPRGLGGMLEATFLNTYYARSVLMVEALGHPCVIGKSMLFRKSLLEKIGGFVPLSEYIAEDYEAGHRLHIAGYQVQYSRDPIEQYIGNYSFSQFWSRHVRWGRIRKLQAFFPFCAEFLIGSTASGGIGAMAFSEGWGISPVHFFLGHMAFWFFCDAMVLLRMGQKPGLSTLPVWLLREIIHLPLWIHISLGNTIQWRGRTIKLGRGGIVKPDFEMIEEEVVEECSRA